MRVVSANRRGGGFSRAVTLLLVLVAIILLGGWFAVRSDGGRDLITSRLSKTLGVPISIDATRIGWPYVVVLENLRTADFAAAGTSGFSVVEARVGFGVHAWSPRLTVRLHQVIARIQEVGDGSVKPVFLAALGDLRRVDAVDVVRATEALRQKAVRLYVKDSTVSWLDAEGVETASMRDVDFRMIPVRIEQRCLHYFALKIASASGVELAGGRDWHWEWLTTQELSYIELSRANAQSGTPVDEASLEAVHAVGSPEPQEN